MKHGVCGATQAEPVYWTNILLEEPTITFEHHVFTTELGFSLCSLLIFSVFQWLMDQQVREDALRFC